ncbi:hypothetical protein GCM10009104_03530 [Marinobacterium maritimum]|uniref:Helix-turn-helix domain-containing protein n=1 Tax=Marinobacterium maritimum TaxID=500162 RepID=A0ABP3TBB9_9GAMM
MEAFRLGAVDFITNPCAPEEVLARIHAQLRHEREMRESNNDKVLQTPQSESEVLLSAAVRQIKEDLAAPISLKALARSIGSNEKQLTQLFRERLGLTVFAYIRQLRLQQAKRLLAESQLSVESIAAQVGYSSAANFATAFKAHETMTPSEFRQQQSAPQPDDQVFASCSASATSI